MTILIARPGLANPGHARPKLNRVLIPFLVLACVSAWLAGCSPAAPAGGSAPGPSLNPKDKAAAEATAIIQSAEATALILQAQAKATALVQSASAAGPTPAPAVTPLPPLKPAVGVASPSPLPTRSTEVTDTEKADTDEVQLVRVEVGTETGLILVQFKAPPAMARKWQQGMVYVVDEATGAKYTEIPVLPVVGPLFGRPNQAGQTGHVMFTNATPGAAGLRRGPVVTVVLGAFKQEHVTVQ